MSGIHRPTFIVYPPAAALPESPVTAADIPYKAARRLVTLFARLGDIVAISNPTSEINSLVREAKQRKKIALFLCFEQPQWLPENMPCPTIVIFPWAYETYPNTAWNGHARHDWRIPLQECAAIITHSRAAATVLSDAVSAETPIQAILDVATHTQLTEAVSPLELTFNGILLDSHALGLNGEPPYRNASFDAIKHSLKVNGPVFTCVLDPIDEAKNWLDTLYGFAIAFRQEADVTLVMLLHNTNSLRVCFEAWHQLQKMAPFYCRILLIIAPLDPLQYSSLLRGTHFYISTAHAHAKAMAMREFMANGVPVVAPRHTACVDLLNDLNSIGIACSREWTSDADHVSLPDCLAISTRRAATCAGNFATHTGCVPVNAVGRTRYGRRTG
jgi:hypothetical protein